MQSAEITGDPFGKLFLYDDYRKFLQDAFAYLKSTKKSFSYRWIAQRAGFSSHSFLESVLKGRRNLTLESSRSVGEALGLMGTHLEFFENLVMYGISETPEGKQRYAIELERYRRSETLAHPPEEAWGYFSSWFYPVLCEAVVHADWNGNFKLLAQIMDPPLSEEQCKEAVAFLVRCNFLRQEDGRWMQADPGITAAGAPESVFRPAKRGLMVKALEGLEAHPRAQRHVSASILAMSEKAYRAASKLLAETRMKIVALALDDAEVEKVFTLNLQLVPLTRKMKAPRMRGRA